MSSRIKLLISWAPVILWMGIIFIFSSLPGEQLPDIQFPNIDKIVHFVDYLILGVLLFRAFLNTQTDRKFAKIVVLSIAIAVLYGLIDEMHQYFVPGRTPDIMDFTFDIAGSFAGVFIYSMRRK